MSELFDKLANGAESDIRNFVATGQQENVQLDFKLKEDSSHGNFSDADKRTLSEALSGFSNSAGGTLIWGVDARKGKDGVDCAKELVPISNITRFQAHATSLVGQFIMPRHEGIRICAVLTAESSDKGYLIVDVDRSERRPHKSEAKGKKGYFKRAGDSFFEMEHYDLEDAFNRSRVADLELCWRLEKTLLYGIDESGGFDANLTLQLRNASTKTARFPYLYVRRSPPLRFSDQSPQNFKIQNEGGWIYFVGGADQVINPETRSSIANIPIKFKSSKISLGFDFSNAQDERNFHIELECRFGCEDMRLRSLNLVISGSDIVAYLQK